MNLELIHAYMKHKELIPTHILKIGDIVVNSAIDWRHLEGYINIPEDNFFIVKELTINAYIDQDNVTYPLSSFSIIKK